jgi:hypothetical protein
MYDLDEVDASEDAVDEVPEFMKPDQAPADDEPSAPTESEASEESGDSDLPKNPSDDD